MTQLSYVTPSQHFIGELKPLTLSPGTELVSTLSVMNSPNDFYLQISETIEPLNSMEVELNKNCENNKQASCLDLKVLYYNN